MIRIEHDKQVGLIRAMDLPTHAWVGGLQYLICKGYTCITGVMVEEECRQRGIATARFAELNCDRVQLDVLHNNWPARRLYEKLGFRYTGRRRFAPYLTMQNYSDEEAVESMDYWEHMHSNMVVAGKAFLLMLFHFTHALLPVQYMDPHWWGLHLNKPEEESCHK